MQEIEDRQFSKAVRIGGYTLRDVSDVKAWSATLCNHKIHCLAFHCKAQGVACMYDFVTTADLITNKAPATQECYGSSWKAARIADTFAITYPETLVKKLEKEDAASYGGYIFTPVFGSAATLEGTVEHSAKNATKR